MTHYSSSVNHIILDVMPARQELAQLSTSATEPVPAPSTTPLPVTAPENGPPPPSVSSLITSQSATDEQERGINRAERMEVDAINLLTGSAPSGPLVDRHITSHDDTMMHDLSEAAIHEPAPDSESASSATSSSTSSTIGPQIDELPTGPQHPQPSGPIITPSIELQSVFFAPELTNAAPMGPVLKQQATTSEVMMDVALIRTGIANDSSTGVAIQSDASSSSPTSSSAPENPLEPSVYPGPSVEMVANL